MLVNNLAARLRIPPNEVKRRMKVAARLRPRRQLTGEPLPPELPLVAQAVAAGAIGEDHLRVIGRAIDMLPSAVSAADRDDVERQPGPRSPQRMTPRSSRPPPGASTSSSTPTATSMKPTAPGAADCTWARKAAMGCRGSIGFIDPETRAYLEAVTAAVRPGRHLPDGTLAEVRR